MWIINFLLYLFAHTPTKKRVISRELKDVLRGEVVYIEWYKILGGIGQLVCLNNDPDKRKILLQITWNNPGEMGLKYEKIILNYSARELKNFSLINPICDQEVKIKIDDHNIVDLQKRMNEALDKEEYELADQLQKKIDKLSQK